MWVPLGGPLPAAPYAGRLAEPIGPAGLGRGDGSLRYRWRGRCRRGRNGWTWCGLAYFAAGLQSRSRSRFGTGEPVVAVGVVSAVTRVIAHEEPLTVHHKSQIGPYSWMWRYAGDGVGTPALLPIGAGRPKTTSSPARAGAQPRWAPSLLIRRVKGAKGPVSPQIYLDCAGNLESQFLVVGNAAFRDVSETISCLPSSLELGSQEAFVLALLSDAREFELRTLDCDDGTALVRESDRRILLRRARHHGLDPSDRVVREEL